MEYPALITLLSLMQLNSKRGFACEVKNFEPTSFLDRKEARKIDRFTQLALATSDMAMADAGLHKDNINPDRIGVVFGSGIGGISTFQNEVSDFARSEGTPRFNPFFIPKMILDIAAGSNIHAAQSARTQLCGCKCLRYQHQCYYRRF